MCVLSYIIEFLILSTQNVLMSLTVIVVESKSQGYTA